MADDDVETLQMMQGQRMKFDADAGVTGSDTRVFLQTMWETANIATTPPLRPRGPDRLSANIEAEATSV